MRLKKISTNKENIKLSNEIDNQRIPEHIAIIMDGNGRWATKKGLPRSFGHNKGVSVLKEIIKVSKNLGCKVLTVYAFSTENWSRPNKEVDFLINLVGNQNPLGTTKSSANKTTSSQNINTNDNITIENKSNKSESQNTLLD